MAVNRRRSPRPTRRNYRTQAPRRSSGGGCLSLRAWFTLVVFGLAVIGLFVTTCGPRLAWEANYLVNTFRTGEFAQAAGENKQAALDAWEAEQAEKKRHEQERLIAHVEASVAQLTNFERTSRGLPPLRYDPAVADIARAHSDNMLEQDKLSHTLDGMGPNDRARVNGYDCLRSLGGGRYERGLAENVSYLDGYGSGSAAKEMVANWMSSPGHRRNILDPDATRIGVGVANAGGTWYATQNFSSCQ